MKKLLLLAALAVAAQTGALTTSCSLCAPGPVDFIATGLEANKTYYVCPGYDSTCLPGARGETSHTWTVPVFAPGSYVATLRTLKGRDWVVISSFSYRVE